jgi:hypothetical protein
MCIKDKAKDFCDVAAHYRAPFDDYPSADNSVGCLTGRSLVTSFLQGSRTGNHLHRNPGSDGSPQNVKRDKFLAHDFVQDSRL